MRGPKIMQNAMTTPMPSQEGLLNPQGLVVLAGESTVAKAVSVALARLEDTRPLVPGTGPIDLITPDHRRRPLLTSAVNEVQRELAVHYPDDTVVRVPESVNTDRKSGSWQHVPAPAGTERFSEILVPGWWSRSARRCLVTSVLRSASAPRLSPMLTLAGLAHPRQRLAARFHQRRLALAAELAAPWRVDLFVVAASRPPFRIVATTHDLIAAELVWLALSAHDASNEDVGPWEDAAVQHATQLGIGVLGPHQVVIDAAHASIEWDVPDQVAARLGVATSE